MTQVFGPKLGYVNNMTVVNIPAAIFNRFLSIISNCLLIDSTKSLYKYKFLLDIQNLRITTCIKDYTIFYFY